MSYQNRQPAHANLKILIVCRQRLIREGLRLLVEQDEDVTVVGTAWDVTTTPGLASRVRPDVVLVCVDSVAEATLDVMQRLFLDEPVLPVVIVASDPSVTQVQRWVEIGFLGILPLNAEPDELFHTLYAAWRGEQTLHPTLARQLIAHLAAARTAPAQPSFSQLTPREREVLLHLAQGACDKDIAQTLFISVRTVQTHLAHIYEKLGVHSRTEVALLSIGAGWVDLPDAEASAPATT